MGCSYSARRFKGAGGGPDLITALYVLFSWTYGQVIAIAAGFKYFYFQHRSLFVNSRTYVHVPRIKIV